MTLSVHIHFVSARDYYIKNAIGALSRMVYEKVWPWTGALVGRTKGLRLSRNDSCINTGRKPGLNNPSFKITAPIQNFNTYGHKFVSTIVQTVAVWSHFTIIGLHTVLICFHNFINSLNNIKYESAKILMRRLYTLFFPYYFLERNYWTRCRIRLWRQEIKTAWKLLKKSKSIRWLYPVF